MKEVADMTIQGTVRLDIYICPILPALQFASHEDKVVAMD